MFNTHKTDLARRGSLVALLVTTCIAASVTFAPSSSTAEEAIADSVMADVTAATPDATAAAAGESIPVVEGASEISSDAVGMTVDFPATSDEPIVLDSDDTDVAPLEIGLPDLELRDSIVTTAQDAVVLPADGDGVDMGLQAFDGGVQMTTVINEASAPTSFAYDVNVPTGGRFEQMTDDGTYVVTDAEGSPMGYIAAPWAVDASGKKIATHFVVSGETITQVVNHKVPGVSYPVVADPWSGRALVRTAKWGYEKRAGKNGAGRNLMVSPTRFARGITLRVDISYLVGTYGFRELRNLKSLRPGLNRHLNSMRDQYICHQQGRQIRTPRSNETWNLNEWRADVSYYRTVRTSCNPPRGGPYAF